MSVGINRGLKIMLIGISTFPSPAGGLPLEVEILPLARGGGFLGARYGRIRIRIKNCKRYLPTK